MGKKKKQFIDKKTAFKFNILHRSQQDPEYHREGGSKLVLHPADGATARALKKLGLETGEQADEFNQGLGAVTANYTHDHQAANVKELREVDEHGFPIDGYDYTKHLAEISGDGMFISKSGESMPSSMVVFPKEKANSSGFSLPSAALASGTEMDRMLEAITLKPEKMDPDMKALLEEDGEFVATDDELEEDDTLEEDFMAQLLDAEANAPAEEEFDYDAHVARLMAEDDSDDEEYDDEIPDEDEMLERVTQSRPRRDIDAHFDTVLENEYDDNEIGELDHVNFDDRVGGVIDLRSDRVSALVDEFANEKQLDKTRGHHEIGATKDNEFVKDRAVKLQQKEEEEATGAADDDIEATKEEMLKRWGYEDRPREKWDCETIVSTYSVLDNHPQLIAAKKKVKKKTSQAPLQEVEQVSDNDDDDIDTPSVFGDVNSAIPRDKKETPEEKRMRKKNVKGTETDS
uniref:Low temperature viability protein n=1 Tax=Mucochytrium quahogii TaxID=96639 RepID=A0A7S2S3F4_9STRA|mmetsp:Transcript_23477/g.50943  ORF Transcript_23477/g.50943 Transcript_23477/m.50943 type:complete len:460 (+) Transcript_23477:122-1501(+)